MIPRDDYFRCKHCLRGTVVKMPADDYSDRHWICPECFSTYVLNRYPVTSEEAVRLAEHRKDKEDGEKWREMQRSFSRPDQMRADVAPVWDSKNIGQ